MAAWIQIALLGLLLASCAQKGPIRIHKPKSVTRPPKIETITDLGGLPVVSQGRINTTYSDGRFTPGEWVLISGKNLTDNRATVHFGERLAPIVDFLENGLLVRMPRGVPYLRPLTVKVITGMGEAEIQIEP